MKATYNYVFVLLALVGAMFPVETFAQACPACSNPALQSSEKLEAGIDTLYKGAFRTTFNVTNGFDYQGGHPNAFGRDPDGKEINVPLHDHVVELDFVRTELSLEYTFKTNWTVWLRVPYDIKIQTASINYLEPVTQYEREAILRNRDNHHRNETYTGISDFPLLLARRINGFLSKKGRLDIALGTSLPLGRTEKNPLIAGKEGEQHLHIQFGSGTFNPLLEFHYVIGLTKRVSLALYSINKLPFYQNNKNYMAAMETTSGIGLGYRVANWLFIRTTFANFSQSQAKWDGIKDPNSGLISFNTTANLTFKLKNGLAITPGYRFPLSQQTLSDEGDTFTYGSTFVLNVSYLFNRYYSN